MLNNRNHQFVAAGLAVLLAGAAIGWAASRSNTPAEAKDAAALAVNDDRPTGDITPRVQYREPRRPRTSSGNIVPAGTALSIAVNTGMTSKTSSVGETWHGEVTQDVYEDGRLVIPAGSSVRGTVRVSNAARSGDRAALQLGLSSVTVRGRSYTLGGTSEMIVAGSPRARNIGAIAGGTAAGALLGKAIGGSTKSTVIGGVVGGAAATAAVKASKGYQAEIDAGESLSFTTSRSVTIRRT
ncbi:MAG TPA: hypothetical protein VEY91_11025 [Candidatus Limnocylindria bacterium]|nr:hypothetical protein [Candidatus Limnocylindria bacterium]